MGRNLSTNSPNDDDIPTKMLENYVFMAQNNPQVIEKLKRAVGGGVNANIAIMNSRFPQPPNLNLCREKQQQQQQNTKIATNLPPNSIPGHEQLVSYDYSFTNSLNDLTPIIIRNSAANSSISSISSAASSSSVYNSSAAILSSLVAAQMENKEERALKQDLEVIKDDLINTKLRINSLKRELLDRRQLSFYKNGAMTDGERNNFLPSPVNNNMNTNDIQSQGRWCFLDSQIELNQLQSSPPSYITFTPNCTQPAPPPSPYLKLFNSDPILPQNRVLFSHQNYTPTCQTSSKLSFLQALPQKQSSKTSHRNLKTSLSHDPNPPTMYLPPLPLSHYYVDKKNIDSSCSSLSFVSNNHSFPSNCYLLSSNDDLLATPNPPFPALFGGGNGRQSSFPETNNLERNVRLPIYGNCGDGVQKNLSETSLLQLAYRNEQHKLQKLRKHLNLLESASNFEPGPRFDDKERILKIQEKDNLIRKYKGIIARTLSKSTNSPAIFSPLSSRDGEFLEDFDYTHDGDEIMKETLNHPHPLSESDLQALSRNIERLESDLENELRLSNQNISHRIKLHNEKNRVEKEYETSMEELAKLEEKIKETSQESLHTYLNVRTNTSNPSFMESLPILSLPHSSFNQLNSNTVCEIDQFRTPTPKLSPPLPSLTNDYKVSESATAFSLDPEILYTELLHKERCLQALYEKIMMSSSASSTTFHTKNQQQQQQQPHLYKGGSIIKIDNFQKTGHQNRISLISQKTFKRDDTLTETTNSPLSSHWDIIPNNNKSHEIITRENSKNENSDESQTADLDTSVRNKVVIPRVVTGTKLKSSLITTSIPTSKPKTITECYAFV